jgi:hypothetical protein
VEGRQGGGRVEGFDGGFRPPTVRFILGRVLGIVYRAIAAHLIHKAGYTRKTAHTGAVTLIQRFGSALNLNTRVHMLLVDGAYIAEATRARGRFQRVNEPFRGDLTGIKYTAPGIPHQISEYVSSVAQRRLTQWRMALSSIDDSDSRAVIVGSKKQEHWSQCS